MKLGLEKSLLDMVGVSGVNSLRKAMYRKDSDSEIGPLDMYLPLLVVPRTILSWLVQNIKPIEIGESETLQFPGMPDIDIKFEKTGRDAYRAEFVKDGKIIHQFEKQTLPNVGGQLMTLGEHYEEEEADESSDMAVPQVMMGMMPAADTSTAPNNWEHVNTMASAIGKLVDALVANEIIKKKVKKAIKGDDESDEESELEKVGLQEAPSGLASPTRGSGIEEPTPQSRDQKSLKPMMAPKPESPKHQNYFKNRLKRIGIAKSEEAEKAYRISEHEIYTPCNHCGIPEFKKTESGPTYKPCACFYVTQKNEDGENINFVRISKLAKGGYDLSFNKKADPDVVQAFLQTLQNRLLSYKNKTN